MPSSTGRVLPCMMDQPTGYSDLSLQEQHTRAGRDKGVSVWGERGVAMSVQVSALLWQSSGPCVDSTTPQEKDSSCISPGAVGGMPRIFAASGSLSTRLPALNSTPLHVSA